MSSHVKIKLPSPSAEDLSSKVTCSRSDSSGNCIRIIESGILPYSERDVKSISTNTSQEGKTEEDTDPNRVDVVKTKNQITKTDVIFKEKPIRIDSSKSLVRIIQLTPLKKQNEKKSKKIKFIDKMKRWFHLDKKKPTNQSIDSSLSTDTQKQLIQIEAATKVAGVKKQIIESEKQGLENTKKLSKKQAKLDKKINNAEKDLVYARMKEKMTQIDDPSSHQQAFRI